MMSPEFELLDGLIFYAHLARMSPQLKLQVGIYHLLIVEP